MLPAHCILLGAPQKVVIWEKKVLLFKKVDLTLRVLNKKSPDFLQKLVLVELSSKTRFFVDILILGDPTTLSL